MMQFAKPNFMSELVTGNTFRNDIVKLFDDTKKI